jgi:hypothetical protein
LARTLATSGGHADLAAEIEHRRAVAEGLARSATQWGDAPLTVGYQALSDVQVRRALLACSVWGSRLSGHDLVRRLWDWQVRDRFRSFRRRFGWRSLSLAARVALERATIEAVADEVCRED